MGKREATKIKSAEVMPGVAARGNSKIIAISTFRKDSCVLPNTFDDGTESSTPTVAAPYIALHNAWEILLSPIYSFSKFVTAKLTDLDASSTEFSYSDQVGGADYDASAPTTAAYIKAWVDDKSSVLKLRFSVCPKKEIGIRTVTEDLRAGESGVSSDCEVRTGLPTTCLINIKDFGVLSGKTLKCRYKHAVIGEYSAEFPVVQASERLSELKGLMTPIYTEAHRKAYKSLFEDLNPKGIEETIAFDKACWYLSFTGIEVESKGAAINEEAFKVAENEYLRWRSQRRTTVKS